MTPPAFAVESIYHWRNGPGTATYRRRGPAYHTPTGTEPGPGSPALRRKAAEITGFHFPPGTPRETSSCTGLSSDITMN
jgi:hypothetical protein